MDHKKLKKYRYVMLSERRDHFGRHNGYNRTKPKKIYAESREAARSELNVILKGRPYKLLLF